MSGFDCIQSDALHRRVQAFILSSVEGEATDESFDELACELARFQVRCGTGLDRLLKARGLPASQLADASLIPAIPTDVFKLTRVACHPREDDEAVYRTSGTTHGARGEHAMRRTDTYRLAAFCWARKMLLPDMERTHILLLAPTCSQAPDSSLSFMLAGFGEHFGLSCEWLIDGSEIRVDRLKRAAAEARDAGQPVLVAGTSFAFVHLLGMLGTERVGLPTGSRVMQTGGFKGKSREVSPDQLRGAIGDAFDIPTDLVVGEYGMTELTSQAYEGTVRAVLGMETWGAESRAYWPPPWMRIAAVHPETLVPTGPGEVGIARITDLANVDSAVAIQSADLVRVHGESFDLLGRARSSTPRGCSIGIDEVLGAQAENSPGRIGRDEHPGDSSKSTFRRSARGRL